MGLTTARPKLSNQYRLLGSRRSHPLERAAMPRKGSPSRHRRQLRASFGPEIRKGRPPLNCRFANRCTSTHAGPIVPIESPLRLGTVDHPPRLASQPLPPPPWLSGLQAKPRPGPYPYGHLHEQRCVREGAGGRHWVPAVQWGQVVRARQLYRQGKASPPRPTQYLQVQLERFQRRGSGRAACWVGAAGGRGEGRHPMPG